MVVKTADAAHRHLVALRQNFAPHFVQRRARAAAGVLRIQRQHQQLAHALAFQRVDTFGDGRFAIRHGIFDTHRFGQQAAQAFGLPAGKHQERRTFLEPDFFISMRAFFAAQRQHDAAQQRLPHPFGQFHYPRIGQKFAQISADRLRLGCGRRAQVQQQHADAFLVGSMGRIFRFEFHLLRSVKKAACTFVCPNDAIRVQAAFDGSFGQRVRLFGQGRQRHVQHGLRLPCAKIG